MLVQRPKDASLSECPRNSKESQGFAVDEIGDMKEERREYVTLEDL